MPRAEATIRLPAGFAGVDPPAAWPRTRSAPHPEALEAPVETLPGVGPTAARRLARLGLRTVGDVLAHRPRRYERPAPERSISELFGDEEAVIEVVVQRASGRRRGRLHILTAHVSDATGEIRATWFNQPWLEAKLTPGVRARLRGRQNRYGFAVDSYDLGDAADTADFAPVYPSTEDLAQKQLRSVSEAALGAAGAGGDLLPAGLRVAEGLPLRADALVALHRPRTLAEAELGRQRLAFDELLTLQLALRRRAAEREALVADALPPPGELVDRYRAVLPFTLTGAQEQAIAEIDADLALTTPMQRLLQGDVGAGKTAVAVYALLRAVEAGRQGALMAPTETLAEQHFLTVEGILAELGVRVALLTSGLAKREHANVRQLITSGDVEIAVGTHALIQRDVAFRDLAVAVVDEQHRFGVGERAAIAEGRSPHVLHMTATPIPRTLALTVYGDLAVSEISAPPANRKPIVTAWVTDDRSSEAYTRLRRHLDEGRQAYVVCPLIEASETTVARAAEEEAERLRTGELRGYRVGCVHGRLRTADRRAVMAAFNARRAGRARRHDRDRGGCRRAERDDHDRAGGRPLRAGAATPVAGPRRARGGAVLLPPDLAAARAALRERGRAARGDGRDDRRLRARGTRSRDPRRGSTPRRAAVGALGSSLHETAGRPRPPRTRPSRRCAVAGRRAARGRRRRPPRSVRAHRRVLGARLDPTAFGQRTHRLRRAYPLPVRVIAGSHRGRRLVAPKGTQVRPTGDRVREAIFNIVGPVDDGSVLDLFAGSGALGIEALSRGARSCVFVESDRAAARVIQQNLERLQLTGAVVERRDALAVLREEGSRRRHHDLILCDPPYELWAGLEAPLAERLPVVLSPDGLLVVETDARTEPQLPLDLVTSRRYGSARITIFRQMR